MYRQTLTKCTRHATHSTIRSSAGASTPSWLKHTRCTAYAFAQPTRRLVHGTSTVRKPPPNSATAAAAVSTASVDVRYAEHAQTHGLAQPLSVNSVRRAGPVSEYERLVREGQFIDDSFQRTIVAKLDRLYQELLSYSPVSRP
ncbi:hypothetical protein GGI05_007659, partial [Coemansia sp. RSA 2603]